MVDPERLRQVAIPSIIEELERANEVVMPNRIVTEGARPETLNRTQEILQAFTLPNYTFTLPNYKRFTPTSKFKVGDEVILNEDRGIFHKGIKMKVITVYSSANGTFDVNCVFGKKKNRQWFNSKFLTKVINDKKPGWF